MDVSKITLGTAQLGFPYGISGRSLQDRPEEILQSAYQSGIDTVDTAKSYGDSEQIIGRYLKTNKSWRPRIMTKIVVEGNSAAGDLRDELNRKVDDSLIKLGQDSVYAVMVHRYESLSRHKQGLVDAMEDLKKRKKAKKIGISIYNEKELRNAMLYRSFEIFQGPVNIFDQRLSRSGLLEELKEQKKEFFARSVFLQGLFFLQDEAIENRIPQAKPYVERLRQLSVDLAMPIEQVALSYVGGIEGIDSFVLGVKSVVHLRSNISLLTKGNMCTTLKKLINKTFQDVPQDILYPRIWSN